MFGMVRIKAHKYKNAYLDRRPISDTYGVGKPTRERKVVQRTGGALAAASRRRAERESRAIKLQTKVLARRGREKQQLLAAANAFRRRLEERIRDVADGDSREFERSTGVPHGTLEGWLAPREKSHAIDGLPRGAQLLALAIPTNTSIDWLLGLDVPRDVRTRSGDESLASALVRHVRANLISQREGRAYYGDIAEFLGARITERRDDLGEVVLEVARPDLFLGKVLRWAVDSVKAIGLKGDEAERAAVLAEIRRLTRQLRRMRHLRRIPIARFEKATRELLTAALDPLSPASHSAIRRLAHELEDVQHSREEETTGLRALDLATIRILGSASKTKKRKRSG